MNMARRLNQTLREGGERAREELLTKRGVQGHVCLFACLYDWLVS